LNCCRETTKMVVPARHASKARRAGHRATVPRYRGIGSETYLIGTSQGPTPEYAGKDGHIRGRSRRFMKFPGSTRRLFGLLHEMGHGYMPVAHAMVTAHLLVTWVSLLRT